MAGFDCASRKYLPTVPRSMDSSRAMRRRDQPRPANVKIECLRLTLRMFIAPMSSRYCSGRNLHLNWLVFIRPCVAGFD